MFHALDKGLNNISFRRTLWGDSLELWNHIKDSREEFFLTDQKDSIRWSLTKSDVYSVKSLYRHLIEDGANFPHKCMWKTKMPSRIKFFVWLLLRNSILTKDNLLKHGWVGDPGCPFCGRNESIDHLFLQCSMAKMLLNILKFAFSLFDIPDSLNDLMNVWMEKFRKDEKQLMMVGVSALFWKIWRLRNSAIFDQKRVTDPSVPVNMIANWLNDWSILQ